MWCMCYIGVEGMVRFIQDGKAYLCNPADFYNEMLGYTDMEPIERGGIKQYDRIESLVTGTIFMGQ